MVDDKNLQHSGEDLVSRPILVPLDGTEEATGILPYVCEVARKADAPLLLHGVIDPGATGYFGSEARSAPSATLEAGFHGPAASGSGRSSAGEETVVMYKDQSEAGALTHAQNQLKKVAGSLKDEGIRAETKTTLGSPAEEILRVADEERCGLIAMSTHGRNAIARGVLGSVTDRVVHFSRLPVLTVTPETAKKYREREGTSLKTVMVPLDGSELAEAALPYVEELARSLSLEVLLVRVVEIKYPATIAYGYGRAVDAPGFIGQLDKEANRYLKRVAQGLKRKGLTVRFQVPRGAPAQALLRLARETPHDIIAMTTHGRSGLSRWLMGSVATKVVRASGDPVLIIPSKS